MSLYIGHLSSRTRRDELEHVFERFGRCNVNLKDGYGFVVYDYPPNAKKALRALQGRNICGKPLTLTWSNKQPRPFKKNSRADQTYDCEPRRMRSSAGDYGNRNFDLNVQPDCKMSIKQPECHGTGLNSSVLLNADIDYHQDHAKQFIREDNHEYREYLLNEDGQDEPNQMDDRWDGQRHDHSNGNDIEHERGFDRYVGNDKKADNENSQIVYSSGCHAEQSPQERIATEVIGGETLNHHKDSKLLQTCYICSALGHKKQNCPHEITSGRYSSRFDPRHDTNIVRGGSVKGVLASFGSSSREKLQQDKDPQRTKRFKNSRKASGSGGRIERLIENGSSFIGKETDGAWENDSEGKKQSRRGGTPQRHNAKNARSIFPPLHPDCSATRSRSKSKSIKHMPRFVSKSRSRSTSSRAFSPSKNQRLSSVSRYSRSRSSKSSSRSSSPTSISSPVSLGKPLASLSDKGQFNLKGSLDKARTSESKEIMVEGECDVQLEIANFGNSLGPMTIENAGLYAKVESDVEKDQAMQGGNYDNHMTPRSVPRIKIPSTPLSAKNISAAESLSPENMREIKDRQDFDALTTEDVIVQPVETDSDTSVRSTSISPEELCMVMKHYGLEPPNENERYLYAEAYFVSARLWPWEIIYYRRLKKGPISTENYARRVAQNKEFGIVDQYIRSCNGWGELNHL
ncbi:Ubiquitin E2 variant 1D-4 [Hibiscus syriacus]|uniref:Ubiquitin E2 variant 1D-4 n=1 Tax=Hibiscus syriacus TaxID=106335 RepID=A0A6A2WXM1_HIBSY|nr:serine/arginine-rich splicing factor 4-like [Hibiscus syriacus]KAE8666181.1 Ubiquitin E2 variant 1D-4 [Hibiscus syriacus]